jgi:integrase
MPPQQKDQKRNKVERLRDRPGSEGERMAAEAALVRLPASTLTAIKDDGLTDAIIRRLPTPAKGSRKTYDSGGVKGFGICITAGNARSFILRYRVRGSGRERCYTIGGFPNWSTTAARKKARDLKRLIDDGHDPLADIEAEREAPTVADLIKRFEAEHMPRLRASSQVDYSRMVRVHIAPHFGKHARVTDVVSADIDALHHKITKAGHGHRANRVIAVLSKMFSLSVRWKMRTDNPCQGVEKNQEPKRERYLEGDELARLTAALTEYPDQQTANVFRLLLLTGARRGEVLTMRWADIDLTTGKWTKPASTTKQKRQHRTPLSAPVRQLLSEIQEAQTSNRKPLPEHVFAGNGSEAHIIRIQRAWRTILKAAGIDGLRIHDLRHSFASELVSSGASLPLIGALLGHSNPNTTARYAHLFDDPLKQAVERVGAVIAAAGKPAKEPTPMRKRRGR